MPPLKHTRDIKVGAGRPVPFYNYARGEPCSPKSPPPPPSAQLPPIRQSRFPGTDQNPPRNHHTISLSNTHLLVGGRVVDAVARPYFRRRLTRRVPMVTGHEEAAAMIAPHETTEDTETRKTVRVPEEEEEVLEHNLAARPISVDDGGGRSQAPTGASAAFRRALLTIHHRKGVARRVEDILRLLEVAPKDGLSPFANPFRSHRQRLHELDEGSAADEDDTVDRFTREYVEGGRGYTYNAFGRRRRESRFAVACGEVDTSDDLEDPTVQEVHPDGTTPMKDALVYFERRLRTMGAVEAELGRKLGFPPETVAGLDDEVKSLLLEEVRRQVDILTQPTAGGGIEQSSSSSGLEIGVGVYEQFLIDLDGGAYAGLPLPYIAASAYFVLKGIRILEMLPPSASAPIVCEEGVGEGLKSVAPQGYSVTPEIWAQAVDGALPIASPQWESRFIVCPFTAVIVGAEPSGMEVMAGQVFARLWTHRDPYALPSLPIHVTHPANLPLPSEVRCEPIRPRYALIRGEVADDDAFLLKWTSQCDLLVVDGCSRGQRWGSIFWRGSPLLSMAIPSGGFELLFTSTVMLEIGKGSVADELGDGDPHDMPPCLPALVESVRMTLANINVPGMLIDGLPARHLLLPILRALSTSAPNAASNLSTVGQKPTTPRTSTMQTHFRPIPLSTSHWVFDWEVDADQFRHNPNLWVSRLYHRWSSGGVLVSLDEQEGNASTAVPLGAAPSKPPPSFSLWAGGPNGVLLGRCDAPVSPPPDLLESIEGAVVWRRDVGSYVGIVSKPYADLRSVGGQWELTYPPTIKGLAVAGFANDVSEAAATRPLVIAHPLHERMPALLRECFPDSAFVVRERISVHCVGSDDVLRRILALCLSGRIMPALGTLQSVRAVCVDPRERAAAAMLQACVRGWSTRRRIGPVLRGARKLVREHATATRTLTAARAKELRHLRLQRSYDELLIIQNFEMARASVILRQQAAEFAELVEVAQGQWVSLEGTARSRIDDQWLLELGVAWSRFDRRAYIWFPAKMDARWMWRRHQCETNHLRGANRLRVEEELGRRQLHVNLRNAIDELSDAYQRIIQKVQRRERRDELEANRRTRHPLPLSDALLL